MTGAVRPRDAALDGLRGFAALAVVWAHAVVGFELLPASPLGGMGVLVFFVLSGYLIARIVSQGFGAPRFYTAFVRRRVVRLAPAIVAFAILGPAALVATGHLEPASAAVQGLMVLTQTTAFGVVGQAPVHQTLLHTWSLTVEWTFYFLFPVCFSVLARRVRTPLMLARAAALSALILYLAGLLLDPRSFYFLPVANLGVMMLGAGLGLAHHAGWTGPERLRLGIWPGGGLAMLVILVFLPGYPIGWGYKIAVLPAAALASALVINGCVAGHTVRRLLSARFFTLVGVRAYSLYIWHTVVFWLTWLAIGSASWGTAALACCALMPVVELSYRLLEVPVLRRGGVRALVPVAREASHQHTGERVAPMTGPVSYTHLTLPTSDLV